MADRRAWTSGRRIARELDDLALILASREAVSVSVDEATSTLVFHIGDHDLWVPIKRGKIHEAQAIARAIVREKASRYTGTVTLYLELFAMLAT
jgi:hypothetical protein